VQQHTATRFSHSLCPACGEQLYGARWTQAMQRSESVAEKA